MPQRPKEPSLSITTCTRGCASQRHMVATTASRRPLAAVKVPAHATGRGPAPTVEGQAHARIPYQAGARLPSARRRRTGERSEKHRQVRSGRQAQGGWGEVPLQRMSQKAPDLQSGDAWAPSAVVALDGS
jgi:hypothetical protein